jgi:ubiquinone/menaquinone biosynthesis C-methylase UbiE
VTEVAHSFDDSAAYERFIGHWGRAAGAVFLDWVAPPTHAQWLDVGCGTGLFTELILDTRSPAAVFAIDHAKAQIDHARLKRAAQRADFRVADAQAIPFPGSTFDVVASALAMNFIPDRARALSEMRRVARPGGVVAGYVWDFAAELSPSGPFRLGMRQLVADLPGLPGTNDSRLEALVSLFEQGGLDEIATRSIDVTVSFPDFEDFWLAQTPSYSPTTKMIAAMTKMDQARLIEAVRARLPIRRDGRIEYPARANAIKARVPGSGLAAAKRQAV